MLRKLFKSIRRNKADMDMAPAPEPRPVIGLPMQRYRVEGTRIVKNPPGYVDTSRVLDRPFSSAPRFTSPETGRTSGNSYQRQETSSNDLLSNPFLSPLSPISPISVWGDTSSSFSGSSYASSDSCSSSVSDTCSSSSHSSYSDSSSSSYDSSSSSSFDCGSSSSGSDW